MLDVPVITGDAANQRFEFTFEAVWKTARVSLKEAEGLEAASPKGVLRASMEVGLLASRLVWHHQSMRRPILPVVTPSRLFSRDRKTINAVVRSLEVLGEAAKRLPEDLRAQTPTIPWKYMTGMRDKLIHGYFGVDLGIAWTVIKIELPPIRPEVERLMVHVVNEK